MIKVEYDNFEEFTEGLDSIQFAKAINKGFAVAGPVVQGAVAKETPVDTGTLRKGWKTVPWNMYYVIENKTKYGPFVNWGTRYITANPFMERGLSKVVGTVRVILFTALRKELYK